MPFDPRDKRQSPRIPYVLRVHYPDRQGVVDATENLSAGGLFIQTEEAFAQGEDVRLALSFPGLLDPLEIRGRVAWRRPAVGDEPGGIGVQVLAESDRQRLAELVNVGPPPGSAAPQALPVEGFRVLIVEDNPHIMEMYSYVLRKLAAGPLGGKIPLEVLFASDGHGALGQLQAAKVNLVLTDLYMPVLDGFQLVERIRGDAALADIPVIAISGGGKDAQERAQRLGVNIFLRKPVKFVEVLETVKKLLHIQ